MDVAYWLFWISLVVAIISGVLGFFVLRTVNRGFFKTIFYLCIAAALVAWFLWFFGGSTPPSTPAPRPPV